MLGLWIEEIEGARFWLKTLNDLKARGVQDILILCGDGLAGLASAVESAFPKTDVQLCVVHHIRNVTQFVFWKDRKPLCADVRPIYAAPTVESAALALGRFERAWGSRYPMSVTGLAQTLEQPHHVFKYPVELRKIIYATNAIESLHAQMRKNISNRKMFPTDESVIKILFLNIRKWV